MISHKWYSNPHMLIIQSKASKDSSRGFQVSSEINFLISARKTLPTSGQIIDVTFEPKIFTNWTPSKQTEAATAPGAHSAIPTELKYWWTSTTNEEELHKLEDHSLFPKRILFERRAAFGEDYPTANTNEVIVFMTHFLCGFGLYPSSFLENIWVLQPRTPSPRT